MTWSHPIDTWIVIVGVLCALSCALLGNFLVLRRMSMMGDAISHAVLPGLAAAFLLTGQRTSVVMFIGAVIVGVLTAVFTQWVHAFGKVERGASMGVVFTTLFAIGLIMIVHAADKVDLDPGCVLYGAIELTPLDVVSGPLPLPVPRAALVLAGLFLVNALIVAALFKEFRISSFDPELATTLGINASFMHYLLMTMVAVTTVASFEVVGSILVIALLIVPAASAHLLTDRLAPMMGVSLLIGAAGAVLGHVLAIAAPAWLGVAGVSTAGSIAAVHGGLFAVTILLAPRQGIVSRTLDRTRLRLRILQEDVLGVWYRLEEAAAEPEGGAAATRDEVAAVLREPPWRIALALRRLEARQRLRRANGHYVLTDLGRREARRVVRSHRLWESYLHRHAALPADHVHAPAHRLEHITGDQLTGRLDEAVQGVPHDPHGRDVPRDPGR